jgi:hypothetical protein
MLWVTRRKIRVNRAATGWLVRRFLDPGAMFCFVDPTQVARIQAAEGGVGFDAPGARYPHKDALGRCSFEALIQEHRPEDSALQSLARIVHDADFPVEPIADRPEQARRSWGTFDTISLAQGRTNWEAVGTAPEAAGLRAISQGFPLVAADDEETLERSAFLYDALYASLQQRLRR